MKKTILVVAIALVGVAVWNYGQATYVQSMSNKGMQFGASRADSMGWWGVNPTTQKVVVATTSDAATLTNLLNELVRYGIVRTN